ncbi:SRPBCC family protein [Streptomyces sp. NPDC053367]|uniref:SRPBCC family protein n=1 Tax=Streptomyces sp. NPDC053367 TaxID=3365700 RepID=UPI0037CCF0BA
MTATARSAASKATGAAAGAADGNPLSQVAHSEAADRLKAEAQEYLAAQAERLLAGLGRKLGETTGKLNDIAEGNSPGFAKLAVDGGRKLAEGKSPMRAALEVGAKRAKDSVTGAVKNALGGKKGRKGSVGQKPTVIMEYVDVAVPLRTAYDQWTRYQDFSTFAKGVKSAQRADDTTSDWQAKIFWSNRSWKAHTLEQLPDDRIAWSSEGAKGTVKGVVSFREISENLTRVLLVIEYYPQGLFEKTGNIWRAQGRRARLDLKHYARYVTLRGEADEGWRGEIRDGEVVRSHEDAMEAEEAEQSDEGAEDARNGEGAEGAEDREGADEEYESDEDGYEDEADDADAEADERDEPRGERDDRDEADEAAEDEDEDEDEDEYDDEAEADYDDEPEDDYEPEDEDEREDDYEAEDEPEEESPEEESQPRRRSRR